MPAPGALPFDIAAGPDGSMWFTEFAEDKIGRISGTGAITEFTVPTANAGPYQITAGAGGAMWFTEYNTTKIGRISGDGTIREFQVGPRPQRRRGRDHRVRAGADGRVTTLALAAPDSDLDGIAAGPGKTIWVTEPGRGAIAEISLA